MLQSYFHAGVAFIDRERYLRYFGPAIETAKLSFERERQALIESGEAESGDGLRFRAVLPPEPVALWSAYRRMTEA